MSAPSIIPQPYTHPRSPLPLSIRPRRPDPAAPIRQERQSDQPQADNESQELKDVVGLRALAAADEVRVHAVAVLGAADVAPGVPVIVGDAAAVEDLVVEARGVGRVIGGGAGFD